MPASRPALQLPGLAYGGDWNPAQWPADVWLEDVRLMQEAGVNLVAPNIFGWAEVERSDGVYDFEALDQVMDLLAEHGIGADLGTGTASPPPWLSLAYPEILPTAVDGHRLWPGSRQAWNPSSRIFQEKALALVEATAEHYKGHSALAMWHVSNELGCHNVHDYGDETAARFRNWLQLRYTTVQALNEAWGTAFWSQRYGAWAEILPPRSAPSFPNPTQQLDFARFSSDALLDYFLAEKAVLRRITPQIPVTTNFMITSHIKGMDYHAWGPEMDVVTNDHYLDGRLDDPHAELAFSADLTRGTAGGGPWLLMESATSAVNWQPRNYAKAPGQLRRDSLQHVARGADGVSFFQWRAARAGAEKFHSALIPHAGTETKVWREVVELGRTLKALEEIAGSRVDASVAILFDWQCWWAADLDSHPTVDVVYQDRLFALHRALWARGITADVVHPSADLSGYRLVIVPTLYLVSDADAQALETFVRGGGTALVTYFSGIVDPNDHVRLGGYPGAFRELLGIRTEEFYPLPPRHRVHLDDGSIADVWTEWLHLEGAEAIASYQDGPLPGVAAITRHTVGEGVAWYVATRLDEASNAALLDRVVLESGVQAVTEAPPGVELVRRRHPDGRSYLFVLNHSTQTATIAGTGFDLLSGEECTHSVRVDAGGVAVLRESTTTAGRV